MPARRKSIDVEIKTAAWRKAWPKAGTEVRKVLALAAAWPALRAKSVGEIALVFADDATLKNLNARFRGTDRPTNVLSFPDGASPPGGGIALAFETISQEAEAQHKPFVNHAKHMILHGFLHILGFHHNQPRAARLMERHEIAILARMGIPNPYLIETKTRA